MDLGIKGKTVLITASSKGIGRATAEVFAAEGCNVGICSRNKDELLNTSIEIKKKYGIEPVWCVCDINSVKEIEATVETITKLLGRIEILVNNCGGPVPGYFQQLSEKNWLAGFEQVLLSAVRFCNLVVPEMILNEWGRIINITSVSVKQPIDNLMLSNSFRYWFNRFCKNTK